MKIGVEISVNFWMASSNGKVDGLTMHPEHKSKLLSVVNRPYATGVKFRKSDGSYIYVDSESSDNDETSSISNVHSSASAFSGVSTGENAVPSVYQSSILNTLVKLTKLWEQEMPREEVNQLPCRDALSTQSADTQPPRMASPSVVGSVDGRSTARTADSGLQSSNQGGITTLMIRNIPLRFTPVSFRELVDEEGFSGRYDYLYMPMDFRSHRSLGYCFINFYEAESASEFTTKFSDRMFPSTNSDKVLAISAAARQGLHANVSSFKQSTLKQMPKMEFRPVVGILGQLFPLDERVFSWLTAGQGKAAEVESPPPGLSALYGLSQQAQR